MYKKGLEFFLSNMPKARDDQVVLALEVKHKTGFQVQEMFNANILTYTNSHITPYLLLFVIEPFKALDKQSQKCHAYLEVNLCKNYRASQKKRDLCVLKVRKMPFIASWKLKRKDKSKNIREP